MIDAAMQIALEKGAHEWTPGCNGISCVNRRKHILAGTPVAWRYRLKTELENKRLSTVLTNGERA